MAKLFDEENGAGGLNAGLKDPNEIKILICTILKSVDKPLSFDSLNEIFQQDGLANYFDFAQCLHELLLTGHVDLLQEDGVDFYKVTKLGAGTADMFERRVPFTIREKAMGAAVKLLAKIRREAENKVEITPADGGFTVECRSFDQKDELFSIRLLVPDIRQAELIRKQFLNNPEMIYQGVLALVTGDVGTAGSLLQNYAQNQKQDGSSK